MPIDQVEDGILGGAGLSEGSGKPLRNRCRNRRGDSRCWQSLDGSRRQILVPANLPARPVEGAEEQRVKAERSGLLSFEPLTQPRGRLILNLAVGRDEAAEIGADGADVFGGQGFLGGRLDRSPSGRDCERVTRTALNPQEANPPTQ